MKANIVNDFSQIAEGNFDDDYGNSGENIESKIDFENFYNHELGGISKPNASGWATGLCPFHDDTNPSLSVNVESGGFYCFSCKTKGSFFSFCKMKYGLTYNQVLEHLVTHGSTRL